MKVLEKNWTIFEGILCNIVVNIRLQNIPA